MQNDKDNLTSKYPRLDFFKSNLLAQSIATKLVDSTNQPFAMGTSYGAAPSQDVLDKISRYTSQDIDDAANMTQILPDLAMAKEILVSLILSPKDLSDGELAWGMGKCDLPTELVGEVTEYLKSYFTQDYDINKLLVPATEEPLFETGSLPLAIIPESSLDDIINQNGRISLESLKDEKLFDSGHIANRAVLGPGGRLNSENVVVYDHVSTGFGLESLDVDVSPQRVASDVWFDTNLRLLDAPDNLKIPLLKEKITEQKLDDRLRYGNISMESADRDIELERLETALFARRPNRHVPVVTVTTASGASRLPQGHPLVMRLPSESIIPVHTPGDPKDHLGYFVLIDEFGNPVTRARSQDYYRQLTSNMNTDMSTYNSQSGSILNNVRKYFGPNCNTDKRDGYELTRAYSEMLKREILERMRRGVYGENVELGDIYDEICAISLARSLAGYRSSMLYIPAKQCVYIAYDYADTGLGKSLLTDVRILGSLRSLLLFSNVSGSIKNSIPRKIVNLELDPDVRDPFKEVDLVQHEFAKTMNTAFPLGVTDPRTQLDMLQKSGVTWVISGNPRYPSTKIDVEERTSNTPLPDQELTDNLKNMMYMGIGLPPEIVDSSISVEFAATIFSSNLLLAKRCQQKQKILTGFMVELVQKYTASDGTLLDGLRKIVSKHAKKLTSYADNEGNIYIPDVVADYFKALELTLPSPDRTKNAATLEGLQEYINLLDVALPSIISEDIMREIMGEQYNNYQGAVYAAIRNDAIVAYMMNENITPELHKYIIKTDADNPGDNFLLARMERLNNLSIVIGKFIEKLANKNGGSTDNPDGGDTGGNTGGTTDTGGGGDDDFNFSFPEEENTPPADTTGSEVDETPPPEDQQPPEDEPQQTV